MTGRRAITGLCLFCALIFSAVAAQSAMALNGTTAFTCKASSGNTGDFTDAHCKTLGTAGKSAFEHVAIPPNETTEIEGSNIVTGTERSTAVLESKQAGIAEQITAGKVSGTGWLTNATT